MVVRTGQSSLLLNFQQELFRPSEGSEGSGTFWWCVELQALPEFLTRPDVFSHLQLLVQLRAPTGPGVS